MKKGISLKSLAVELKRQHESKRDFIVNTRLGKLTVTPIEFESGPMALTFNVPQKRGKGKEEVFQLNRWALTQIAQHTNVPVKLIDTMTESKNARERLAIANLLTVRLQENEAKRMIRTMEDKQGTALARGFLSESYRKIDNYDLANDAILPVMQELPNLIVESCQIDDEKMYIKALNPELEYSIGETRAENSRKKVGDIVQAGIAISNSEVGSGRVLVEPLVFRLVCLNGMIVNDAAVRRNHVGRKSMYEAEGSAFNYEIYGQDTLALEDAAFFAKVRDTVRATIQDEDKFVKILGHFMESQGQQINGHAQAAVVELGRRFTLNESEQNTILDYLAKGGDLTKFGMINAVTRASQDIKTYSRATELERIGGSVLELPASEWKVIANAKKEEVEK